jgi:hypothetical protein
VELFTSTNLIIEPKSLKPKEEWMKIEIPPIITAQQWERAQVIRREREPKRTNPAITGSKTLLTGICFCGICGRGMQMETAKGGSYIYYNCRNYVRSGKFTCHGQRIPVQDLERAVLSHMSNRLFTKERIKRILAGVRSKSKTLILGSRNLRNRLIQERRDAQNRLQREYDAIERGIVSSSDVSDRIKELKAKRNQIDDKLQKIQAPLIPPNVCTDKAIEDFQTTIKNVFLNPDRGFAKSYLRLLIERVTINGRKVKIEGRPSAILTTMQNKTAVKTGVLTAVNNWLPGVHDLRTTIPVIPMSYIGLVARKSVPLEKVVNKPEKHIIHKAFEWKRMLDEGAVGSLKEIAAKEGLTQARVTQVMNLLKLPAEWKELLLRLESPKDIRKYSERRLRNYQAGRYIPAPDKKKLHLETTNELPKKSRGKQKHPPKIIVVEIDEPLPQLNLEAQKKLIQKAALRKLKKLNEEKNRD